MGGGGGMGGGEGMGGGGMGGGGGAPSMPQVKATVRWETAAPLLQTGRSKFPEDAIAGHYLISVTGLPGGGMGRGRRGGGPPVQQFQGGQGQPGQPGMMDPEERRRAMQERLKEVTRLERKGKDPIAPDRVETGQAGDGTTRMVFLFPKTSQPIEPGDKEVTFVTQMGPFGVKAKFPLKDMMVKGKLEL